MKELFQNIKIVPISSVLVHEGIVTAWLSRLSNNIDHADDQSLSTFEHHENAFCLVIRPFFSKEQVITRILQGRLFPRKSTRHIFPLRPLRVDIDFILLKEDMDLQTKNRLLQSRLDWCLENNMVRYYPESVLVFSD